MPATPQLTVALCCHNSAERLPETLRHLAAQNWAPGDAPFWEVLVIDNASTDATAAVAHSLAEQFSQISASSAASSPSANSQPDFPAFRVINEPTPGLSVARRRAFTEARGEVVCFLDDDNWAPPHWVRHVATLFSAHPQIAAAGGPISEILQISPPPFWFERFKGNFTIWNPRDTPGVWEQPLCGAGLCVRKAAWQDLLQRGFSFQLSDRKGQNLSSGGDFELCYALMRAGWKLWFDPSLHIRHFMPASRLTWDNLVRLNYGFGAQSIVFDAYTATVPLRPWWFEWLLCQLRILKSSLRLTSRSIEGDPLVLFLASQRGRRNALASEKSAYQQRPAQLFR